MARRRACQSVLALLRFFVRVESKQPAVSARPRATAGRTRNFVSACRFLGQLAGDGDEDTDLSVHRNAPLQAIHVVSVPSLLAVVMRECAFSRVSSASDQIDQFNGN